MANITVNGQTILEKVSGAVDYKVFANGQPIKEVYSNGASIYRAYYHYWGILSYGYGSFNINTSGYFCNNTSSMVNQLNTQYPPNNISLNTIALVYDTCSGAYFRFQVYQQYL